VRSYDPRRAEPGAAGAAAGERAVADVAGGGAGGGAIAGFLLAEDSSADLTKMVVGGWIAALGSGNVIGFYFGARTGG
jgi:hypothetical protein